MKRIRKLNDHGMGLLEVLVSMIILALGILGLAPLIVTAVDGNVISRDNSVASNLIKQQIEIFEALDSLPSIPYKLEEPRVEQYYTRTTLLIDNTVDTLVPAGLCQLDVAVYWTDHKNMTHTRTYSTYIPKG